MNELSIQGTQLVSGSSDCTLRVWDLRTGAARHELKGHATQIVSMHHCGRRVVSGAKGQISLWDARDGTHVRDIVHGVQQVWKLQFSETRLVAALKRHGVTMLLIIDYDLPAPVTGSAVAADKRKRGHYASDPLRQRRRRRQDPDTNSLPDLTHYHTHQQPPVLAPSYDPSAAMMASEEEDLAGDSDTDSLFGPAFRQMDGAARLVPDAVMQQLAGLEDDMVVLGGDGASDAPAYNPLWHVLDHESP